MRDLKETASGQAEIESTFTVTGRGLALVLKDGFTGAIPKNGSIQGEHGAMAFAGPEFCDGRDAFGARKSWLAVIVRAEDAATFFRPGDVVAFFP